jgi:Conserved region of unknown function on GLTSCR protein
LPYHVVSDYEAEEDDRMIESDKTGQAPSRLQQWDHNILVKIAEFTSTFEKQVLAFNIMTRKRSLGEFRSEERLHLEQTLVQNEKRIAFETRAEIEARQKAAAQMAASAAQADMMGSTRPPAPMRGHAASVRGENTQDQEVMHQGVWAGKAGNSGVTNANANDSENGDNNGEEEEDGDEDFLNNEENGDDEDDDSGGELDLNAR